MAEPGTRVGVIGVGNIGGAIVANLLRDGYAVTVHDTDTARCAALAGTGAKVVHSPAEVAAHSEVTFTSLPRPEVMEAVAHAWLLGAPPDTVLVDLTTNAPGIVRSVGALLSASGCHLLEAPLTGGVPGAQARTLVFMVGGDAAVFARCRPLLERLGRATFHMGGHGLGNTAKLVNSLLAFAETWVSLEGLAVAVKSGIDLRTMIAVIRAGGAGNFFTDRSIEYIDQRGRPTQFALGLAAKDAGLLVEVAREVGVPVPLAAEMAQVLVAAVGAGLGDRDFTDLVELMERHADVRLQWATS
jgi:3-hydroxyisobutyrate dehydrogenase-like beta-hydroxyacid dehydrogenase